MSPIPRDRDLTWKHLVYNIFPLFDLLIFAGVTGAKLFLTRHEAFMARRIFRARKHGRTNLLKLDKVL